MPGTTKMQTLQARLDPESKRLIEEAARLRHVGLTDYIRLILVPAARREVLCAQNQALFLSPTEQEQFWEALNSPLDLTPAQEELGAIMRGEK